MRIALIAFCLLGLAACNTTGAPAPVGVGSDIHELKRSPCACLEIPMVLPQDAAPV